MPKAAATPDDQRLDRDAEGSTESCRCHHHITRPGQHAAAAIEQDHVAGQIGRKVQIVQAHDHRAAFGMLAQQPQQRLLMDRSRCEAGSSSSCSGAPCSSAVAIATR